MRRTVLWQLLCFVLGLALGALALFFFLRLGWLPNTRAAILTGPAGRPASLGSVPSSVEADPSAPPQGNEALLIRAMEVARYIRDQNWSGLSHAAHPEKGVRFTPYSSVDAADMVFSAGEIASFGSNTRSYMWGYRDGSGAPMNMTVADYFSRFVFNADYTQAPFLSVNHVQVYGNALENVADAYPEGCFVEFYYSGLDPANEGFDWCALKLVFERYEEQLMLVGIIHSEWTI